MDNSKENILRLVKAMKNDCSVLKDGTDNSEMQSMFSYYGQAYQEFIWMLTDNQYFNDLADIYSIK